MKSLEIARRLVSFSPRQLEGEKLTRDYILDILKKEEIGFKVQKFKANYPIYEKYYLKADGKEIKCVPTALKSGRISKNDKIINSLSSTAGSEDLPNINYNPYCSIISVPNYFHSPSLAIRSEDVERVSKASEIDGLVKVKKKTYQSANIIAGNLKNPKNIAFAHYDCFGDGAADNASGVAVSIEAILKNKDILRGNLVIFSGSEELSFDYPDYWGKGFRVFEDKYIDVLDKAENIYIVDCVGTGKPALLNDMKILPLFFPIKNLGKYARKIYAFTSCYSDDEFMKIYHSDLDKMRHLNGKYLDIAVKMFIKLLSR